MQLLCSRFLRRVTIAPTKTFTMQPTLEFALMLGKLDDYIPRSHSQECHERWRLICAQLVETETYFRRARLRQESVKNATLPVMDLSIIDTSILRVSKDPGYLKAVSEVCACICSVSTLRRKKKKIIYNQKKSRQFTNVPILDRPTLFRQCCRLSGL